MPSPTPSLNLSHKVNINDCGRCLLDIRSKTYNRYLSIKHLLKL
uniref:Uncharacterized protein n=1 Tax=Lepeophtheirus salmonis TaxID=72036 RepID=A0A0K2SYP1_LEPSM